VSFPGMRLLHMRLILKWGTVLAFAELLGTLPVAAHTRAVFPSRTRTPLKWRAVGVLEWTGDQDHPRPAASFQWSVYDGAELQDGGIYLARPAATCTEQ